MEPRQGSCRPRPDPPDRVHRQRPRRSDGRASGHGALLILLALAALQDVVEFEVRVSRRDPTPIPFLLEFEPREPLKLQGTRIEAASIRKAVDYLLARQEKDGSWVYSEEQIPEGDEECRIMLPVAKGCLNPVVLTSLACMALRAHGAERGAIDKGREYVSAHLREIGPADYAIWTWAFAARFLARADRAATEWAVRKILEGQHAGSLEPVELRAVESEEARPSRGGSIDAYPQLEVEPRGGIYLKQVDEEGAAHRAGLRTGDRVFEIDGRPVHGVGEFFDMVDSLEPGRAVKVRARRGLPAPVERRRFDDGGWAYYSWAEGMSFTTATALHALFDARDAGVDVPKEPIERGARLIEALRIRSEAGEAGYRYRALAAKGYHLDIRSSIGRLGVCALALERAGRESGLDGAVETFLARRGELDRSRGFPGSHNLKLFGNTAYYFLYGHYFTARALKSVKDPELRKRAAAAIEEVLARTQRPEGTWTDHDCWGRVYGTAMALMALGELR